MQVIATAGHVDHGKSTLVEAVTGTHPDRLVEEKARGLTVDLGFASTTLPSGRRLAFVDVPGHSRFISNMLAGVGAVQACVMVVAATEGWKPQSEEHLRILELLGVEHGIVALTKVGLVDSERLHRGHLQLAERLRGTFLEGAPVVEVDVPAGIGLLALNRALDALVEATPRAIDRGRPRLWIDRCFTVRGAGTVVTGTLVGGSLAVGDQLEVQPGTAVDRGPQAVRVRGLHCHDSPVVEIGPGHRVAVNLLGLSRGKLGRGHALVRPGQWAPTTTVDASLQVLKSLDHDVGRRGAYHLHTGSGRHPVAVRILGDHSLAPGEHGLVRLHLPNPLPLLPGDRYVLRESGRSETVGGGEVFDVAPVLAAARAHPDRSVDRVIAERQWIDTDELERLTGERREPNLAARWVVDPGVLEEERSRLRGAVDASGPLGLDLTPLSERDRAVLAGLEGVRVQGSRAQRVDAFPDQSMDDHPYLGMLVRSPFAPPDPTTAGVTKGELWQLVSRGRVVERDGCYFAAEAMDRAALAVARMLSLQPDGVTASMVRERLGTTRKYAIPILGYLDATGVTRRRGDVRIAGPRLPAVDPQPVPTVENGCNRGA